MVGDNKIVWPNMTCYDWAKGPLTLSHSCRGFDISQVYSREKSVSSWVLGIRFFVSFHPLYQWSYFQDGWMSRLCLDFWCWSWKSMSIFVWRMVGCPRNMSKWFQSRISSDLPWKPRGWYPRGLSSQGFKTIGICQWVKKMHFSPYRTPIDKYVRKEKTKWSSNHLPHSPCNVCRDIQHQYGPKW